MFGSGLEWRIRMICLVCPQVQSTFALDWIRLTLVLVEFLKGHWFPEELLGIFLFHRQVGRRWITLRDLVV